MTIKYYYMFSISTGSKRGDFANTELEDLFSLFKNTEFGMVIEGSESRENREKSLKGFYFGVIRMI